MLKNIKGLIKKNISDFEQNIYIEEIKLLGDKKVDVTVSTVHLMGSIEILKDLTTDLLIVEFESEDIVYSQTFENIKTHVELDIIIGKFFQRIDNSENNFK